MKNIGLKLWRFLKRLITRLKEDKRFLKCKMAFVKLLKGSNKSPCDLKTRFLRAKTLLNSEQGHKSSSKGSLILVGGWTNPFEKY